jgi:hypothetical protein
MKPAVQALSLQLYKGRMLTLPEILLLKFHESRHAEAKRIKDEKAYESQLLSTSVVAPRVCLHLSKHFNYNLSLFITKINHQIAPTKQSSSEAVGPAKPPKDTNEKVNSFIHSFSTPHIYSIWLRY